MDHLLEEYKGHKILNSDHAIERFIDKERFTDAGKEAFKKDVIFVVEKAIDKILLMRNIPGVYGIHSNSTMIGLVIDYNDHYSRKINDARIVTLFPKRKIHSFKPGDIKLFVESLLTDWAKENSNEPIRITESAADTILNESRTFFVSFWEGKLYDHPIKEFIFVD